MRCASCKGPYHPATGHAHSEKTVICGVCTRSMLKWLEGQTHRKFRVGPKGSKVFVSFYGREDK
jgi:hypothetical protein